MTSVSSAPKRCQPTFARSTRWAIHDVTLSRHDVAGLSARNDLQGRVCQVVPLRQAASVAIDVGQVIRAEATPQAAAELELKPGSQVICLLKAHSLRVID